MLTTRQKMIDYRNEHYITLEKMSRRVHVSEGLLGNIEDGWVTHPNIVERIQREYGLTDIEAEELLPENRRPSSPNYEPCRFVVEPNVNDFCLLPRKEAVEEVFNRYICDKVKIETGRRQ